MQIYIDTLEAENTNILEQLESYTSLSKSCAEMYSQDLQVS